MEAARDGRLPRLVELADLRGDCHAHSDWSDGIHTIEQMAEAARARGYGYLVLTDHSHGLAIARGLTPERVAAQRAVIAELNARFAREEEAGTAPAGRRRPAASGSSTAASWRSAATARSTSTTSCSPRSTSSWRRSTRVGASRARS